MSTTDPDSEHPDGENPDGENPDGENPQEPVEPDYAARAAALTPADIEELRKEIDWLDAEILRLVQRRVEVSKTVGAVRMAAGGPRIVVRREMAILDRYRELGPEGRQLAMALLNLGRGRLGRS